MSVAELALSSASTLQPRAISMMRFTWRLLQRPPQAAAFSDSQCFSQVLDDGCIEVGVHIADVSFFVRTGTALDNEAKLRSTTVYAALLPVLLLMVPCCSWRDRVCSYMQQFAVPMLPHMLCEQLCSLNPGVDRYAFSTIFRWFHLLLCRCQVQL